MTDLADRLEERGENPIAVLRAITGLSLRKAALVVPCHHQTLYMAEHGMFTRIPPRLMSWALSLGELNRVQISMAYSRYVTSQRTDAVIEYKMGLITLEDIGDPGSNPIKSLRLSRGLSQSAFCKAFCMPVAWLYQSETRNKCSPKMMEALRQLGVPYRIIVEIPYRFELLNG